MSLRTKPFTAGDLVGVVYDFEVAGDELPMHNHTDEDIHITVVARGSVLMHGPEIGNTTYVAGAVIDMQPGFEHEFVATMDNTRIVNILKRHRT